MTGFATSVTLRVILQTNQTPNKRGSGAVPGYLSLQPLSAKITQTQIKP